jgi:hypothetical protein
MNDKEKKTIEKLCICKCSAEVKILESNNYFKYSRLERMSLLKGFRIVFDKIYFILTS